MAFTKSVQFRGTKNAIDAYENMDLPKWGLFQGNQFLLKYDGSDVNEGKTILKTYLDALDQRSSDSNTYTLCLYDVADGTKINSATKYDASFNFRLVDNVEDHVHNRYAAEIAGLQEQIKALTEPEPPPPSQRMWDALGKLLEHPQVQQIIASKVLTLVDGLGNVLGGMFQKPVHSMGNTTTSNAIDTRVADENAKLQEAVNILVTVDNQLGTHLLKLAAVAKADPAKYQSLISMLNLL